ncbi:MAG: spore coat associated protein CotJA [Firmicutes bacterium]|nr:spore coat associated protein CotJA [Bacillota bacterium]
MFICKFCGFMSRDDSVHSCGNRICRGYAPVVQQTTTQARCPASLRRSCTAYTYSTPSPRSVSQSISNSDVIAEQSTHTSSPPPVRPPVESQMPSDVHSLAFATVPFQKASQILPQDKWLTLGTIFPELAHPYTKKIFDRS